MLGIKFTRQMWWAWFFFAVVFVGPTLPDLLVSEEAIFSKIIRLCTDLISPGIFVFAVRLVRGPYRRKNDVSENPALLSAWGYLWRAFVAGLGVLLLFLGLDFVFPGVYFNANYSAVEGLLWLIAGAPVCIVAAWVFFSRDHIGQVKYLFSSLRGF